MIDIHCHILPMVDDGSNTMETSLAMLDAAYHDGSDAFILTPHYACEYGFDNPKEKVMTLFEEFKEIVRQEGIPVTLYSGCEFLFSSAESFNEHFDDITLMNHTRYQLMEFYFNVEETEIIEAVDCVLNSGRIPILAHPERYECVQIADDLAEMLVERGALLQMNKGSILGRYGEYAKDAVHHMLGQRLISFIGSDAHHIRYRTPMMSEAYDVVAHYYGKRYADRIFYENPQNLLNIQLR